MRSGNPSSEFCSSFLVHSICALASMHRSDQAVFSEEGNMLTRGDRFHKQALRLYYAEEGRASLTNLQAVMILIMSCGFRGHDKLGLGLLTAAVGMESALTSMRRGAPPLDVSAYQSLSPVEQARIRARFGASCGIACTEISYRSALLLTSAFSASHLESLASGCQMLPVRTEYWVPYPLSSNPLPWRRNIGLQARMELVRLVRDLCELLFGVRRILATVELRRNATALAKSFHNWMLSLPVDLRYSNNMPTPVYELHRQYLCAVMVLHITVWRHLRSPTVTEEISTPEHYQVDKNQDFLLQALSHARQGSRLLKDFRETYGLRLVPPFVVQPAQIGSLLLLEHLDLDPISPIT
ncbi:hypothetical protein CLAFUW4_00492 [Fulvia fulva]|uniref:Transcription factor domain-containing protein n=1 Tax=Passalora fulva TaxID=5499 RepID=A0A9Q8P2P0_PASFU|nr:uncharacterized protein CLAFUR5_00492 [Fulvia fulva]KAK4634876.1 hypothetical protein CLAFUR4_00492 [Fulvia fulva]UJO10949.1 hypothetical protein CLAFUR5_00492 [Fulvia fulva]WPV09620.1 hypothetical protein CLAFUW4_00492 [Fulvia fulva]WPV25236.1 hypothetical protein CLAFUW7_00496 [Fulvia fulva]